MAEDIENIEVTDDKMKSRKFIVWLIWGIICFLTLAIALIVLIFTKSFPTDLKEILKLVLEYFFYISLVYLGVNGIQKIGYAVSDAITTSKGTKK